MPRRPPIDPQGYYHVGSRGSYGQLLFRTPDQYELFLRLYERSAAKYRWETLDWVPDAEPPSLHHQAHRRRVVRGLRELHGAFSRRIHAMYGMTGQGHLVRHAFFGREFASDAEILVACRYVDLNEPTATGKRPEATALGRLSRDGRTRASSSIPQARPSCFGLISPSPNAARAAYRQFVQEGLDSAGHDPSPNQGVGSAPRIVVESRVVTVTVVNPATEETIASLAVGWGRRDRRGGGSGSRGLPRLAGGFARGSGRLLRRLASLVEEHGEELARIESRERRQADLRRARRDRDGRRRLPLLRRRGRQALRRDDPRRRRRRPDVPRAARRRRADRAVELPAQHRLLEARARARLRQHRRAEARRADAALRAAARRARRSRPASPKASSTSSSARAPSSASGSSSIPTSRRSASPARPRSAAA